MTDPISSFPAKRARLVDAALWLAQWLLFAGFGWAAWMKIMTPIPALAAMWPWAGDLPEPAVRALGGIDLAGGAGLVLPILTGIRPRLTVAAALGCIALQLCAMIFHGSRGEWAALPVNLVFLAMAGFVYWGRR